MPSDRREQDPQRPEARPLGPAEPGERSPADRRTARTARHPAVGRWCPMTVAARDREDVLTEGVCAYCGHVSAYLEVEHTFHRSRGGSDEPFNLVAACYLCNAEKLARTPAEWRADREAAGLPWPPPSIMQTRQTFQDEVMRIDPEAFEHAEEAWSLREMYEDIVAN